MKQMFKLMNFDVRNRLKYHQTYQILILVTYFTKKLLKIGQNEEFSFINLPAPDTKLVVDWSVLVTE